MTDRVMGDGTEREGVEALETLRGIVRYLDDNPDDPALQCACLGASPDCPHPPPCIWCQARALVTPPAATPAGPPPAGTEGEGHGQA